MKTSSPVRAHLAALVLVVGAAGCPSGSGSEGAADASVARSGPDAGADAGWPVAPPDAPGDTPAQPPVPASCGDGIVAGEEACEPTASAPRACTGWGPAYEGGMATCGVDCRWRLDGCTARQPRCGDQVLDRGEDCEPTLFPGTPCAVLSAAFAAGQAACTPTCRLDLAACVRAPAVCGNGLVEGEERCDDGNNDDGDDCRSDCTPLVRGQPVLYEGPLRGAGRPGTIIDAGSKCVPRAARDGWREKPMADVLYDVLLCQRKDGSDAFAQATIDTHMTDVARVFADAAHIRLVRNALRRFRDDDCVLDYDSNQAGTIAAGTGSGVVPVVFATRISTMTSSFGIGGYAVEGQYVVSTAVAGGTTTTIHELGHFFGLAHTHDCDHGVETTGACATTGDLFCDTPPDRGPETVSGLQVCRGREVDGSCTTNGCGAGTCTDGSMPDRNNFMSYYHCWPGDFSVEQSDYMRCQLSVGSLARFNWREVCSPRAEECNNVDDDCDGSIDEDVTQPCGSSTGDCRPGLQRCSGGRWNEVCEGQTAAAKEVCDGRDNDCDGKADEDLDPLAEPMDMRCPQFGICAAGGARPVCTAGRWLCQLPAGYQVDECPVVTPACGNGSVEDASCNDGRDNDCDGVTDEHSLYPACMMHPGFSRVKDGETCFVSTRGRCAGRGGVYKCVQLAEGCGVSIDCVGATFPQAEQCDGQDWDCDGQVYDRNDLDRDGYGDCDGRRDCDEGNGSVNPGVGEVCNGRDDNCVGGADETFACGPGRESRTCTVCGRVSGVQSCDLRSCSYQPVCRAGGGLPTVELHYEGNHPDLYHEGGGACDRSHWCAVGIGEKALSYGPYVALGAASYRVKFTGTFSNGALWFDVFDATTGAVLAKTDAVRAGPASISFGPELGFSIPRENACHKIEFRMFVNLPWPAGASLHAITVMRDTDITL